METKPVKHNSLFGLLLLLMLWGTALPALSASDPGLRRDNSTQADEHVILKDLTDNEKALWNVSKEAFGETETVAENGLGPTFNLDSCVGCHSYPKIGGSSPPNNNPQFMFWDKNSDFKKHNKLPPFITQNGPAREARYQRNPDGSADGGVHDLFTIAGLPGAEGCTPTQPDFDSELRDGNVIFRIPTPTFGLGLIEQIRDTDIIENHARGAEKRARYQIAGKLNIVNIGNTISVRVNRNGNDGTVSRFGWKAQNKSLLVFAGEAYNVEMGVTNELFQTERDETLECEHKDGMPNDISRPNKTVDEKTGKPDVYAVLSDIERFAIFMRFLAPPEQDANYDGKGESVARGFDYFKQIGCEACHTESFMTGPSKVAALSKKEVRLFSDLALHNMGRGLEDGISQGAAAGNEFRTAPLWGLGQRAFFLHDGRTSNLIEAIHWHESTGSEANLVVKNYDALDDDKKQDVLNFLRSL